MSKQRLEQDPLAIIAQQWKLALEPGQRVTPKPFLTLRSKDDIMMRVARHP
jgi:hypothetical protein